MKTKLTVSCAAVMVALNIFGAFALNNKVSAAKSAKGIEVGKLKAADPLGRIPMNRQQAGSRITAVSAWDTVYAESFDAGAPGWTFQDLWSETFWHVSTTGAFSGHSYWCGIEEQGGYNDKWIQLLTSPAIDLSRTTSPLLTFMQNYSLELPGIFGSYDAWDAITVRISTDSTTFNVIEPVGGYPYSSAYGFHLYYGIGVGAWAGKSNGYVKATFDLSAFAGKKVWIRFEFGSDDGTSSTSDLSLWGWRVDNIEVTAGGTRVFFDDAGDTGTAQFVAGGPGGPNLWHITGDAAASAPNSAGCFDATIGNYRSRMKAGLVSPAIAIDALPTDTQELFANFKLQGMLDPAVSAGGEGGLNLDLLYEEIRAYRGGVWSYWFQTIGAVILPGSFAEFPEVGLAAFIGADSVQFRITVLTQPDGEVVSPANVFIDDFTLTAYGSVLDVKDNQIAPQQFTLHQNYPNPFNPSTIISYDLPKSAQVKLVIYNVLGKEVRKLVDARETAGHHEITWNSKNDAGSSVVSGMYFYKITAGELELTQKFLLLK